MVDLKGRALRTAGSKVENAPELAESKWRL